MRIYRTLGAFTIPFLFVSKPCDKSNICKCRLYSGGCICENANARAKNVLLITLKEDDEIEETCIKEVNYISFSAIRDQLVRKQTRIVRMLESRTEIEIPRKMMKKIDMNNKKKK